MLLSISKITSALSVLAFVQAQTEQYTGEAFIFDPGLGACGFTNNSAQLVASVSPQMFNSFPGANSANPNKNPICHHSIHATYNGVSVQVPIVDHFTRLDGPNDIGLTLPAFSQLDDPSDGVVNGVTWYFV